MGAIATLFPSGFRSIDRRWHLGVDRDHLLDGVRPFFDLSEITTEPVSYVVTLAGPGVGAATRLAAAGQLILVSVALSVGHRKSPEIAENG